MVALHLSKFLPAVAELVFELAMHFFQVLHFAVEFVF